MKGVVDTLNSLSEVSRIDLIFFLRLLELWLFNKTPAVISTYQMRNKN